mmetsp:Transcript_29169/g.66909  ORF Transcript_29169/g.66909 Transcript_29169/m.66909 type:complete len:220 (+) Transcript_29169:698-1357(+)
MPMSPISRIDPGIRHLRPVFQGLPGPLHLPQSYFHLTVLHAHGGGVAIVHRRDGRLVNGSRARDARRLLRPCDVELVRGQLLFLGHPERRLFVHGEGPFGQPVFFFEGGVAHVMVGAGVGGTVGETSFVKLPDAFHARAAVAFFERAEVGGPEGVGVRLGEGKERQSLFVGGEGLFEVFVFREEGGEVEDDLGGGDAEFDAARVGRFGVGDAAERFLQV